MSDQNCIPVSTVVISLSTVFKCIFDCISDYSAFRAQEMASEMMAQPPTLAQGMASEMMDQPPTPAQGMDSEIMAQPPTPAQRTDSEMLDAARALIWIRSQTRADNIQSRIGLFVQYS